MAHSYAYLDKEKILHLHPLEDEAVKHGKYVVQIWITTKVVFRLSAAKV
ncbi:hypothetical protein [Paenibacillus polymyxa]